MLLYNGTWNLKIPILHTLYGGYPKVDGDNRVEEEYLCFPRIPAYSTAKEIQKCSQNTFANKVKER